MFVDIHEFLLEGTKPCHIGYVSLEIAADRVGQNVCKLLLTLAKQVLCCRINFWATVCKTVHPMLSVCCLSVCPVCDIHALWSNSWTDQDETWRAPNSPTDLSR